MSEYLVKWLRKQMFGKKEIEMMIESCLRYIKNTAYFGKAEFKYDVISPGDEGFFKSENIFVDYPEGHWVTSLSTEYNVESKHVEMLAVVPSGILVSFLRTAYNLYSVKCDELRNSSRGVLYDNDYFSDYVYQQEENDPRNSNIRPDSAKQYRSKKLLKILLEDCIDATLKCLKEVLKEVLKRRNSNRALGHLVKTIIATAYLWGISEKVEDKGPGKDLICKLRRVEAQVRCLRVKLRPLKAYFRSTRQDELALRQASCLLELYDMVKGAQCQDDASIMTYIDKSGDMLPNWVKRVEADSRKEDKNTLAHDLKQAMVEVFSVDNTENKIKQYAEGVIQKTIQKYTLWSMLKRNGYRCVEELLFKVLLMNFGELLLASFVIFIKFIVTDYFGIALTAWFWAHALVLAMIVLDSIAERIQSIIVFVIKYIYLRLPLRHKHIDKALGCELVNQHDFQCPLSSEDKDFLRFASFTDKADCFSGEMQGLISNYKDFFAAAAA